jgi:hypothetical protein
MKNHSKTAKKPHLHRFSAHLQRFSGHLQYRFFGYKPGILITGPVFQLQGMREKG